MELFWCFGDPYGVRYIFVFPQRGQVPPSPYLRYRGGAAIKKKGWYKHGKVIKS